MGATRSQTGVGSRAQWCSSTGKRAKRAVIVSQRTRQIARLAQIPSASLGTGSSLRKERLFRMTIELHHYQVVRRILSKNRFGAEKRPKSQIAGFNITSVTLVFGEFFKLTSPEEAEN